MTKIEDELTKNGKEYRALLNLLHVHSNQQLIEWLLKYDVSDIPCVITEEKFVELKNAAVAIANLAAECYAEVAEGRDVINTAFEDNRGKQKELQTLKAVFKL